MVSGADNLAGGLLALADRGAGVPLRELALVGLTAAIITYFVTGPVRVLATEMDNFTSEFLNIAERHFLS